jgi:Flp pilus assembly pilin Flp
MAASAVESTADAARCDRRSASAYRSGRGPVKPRCHIDDLKDCWTGRRAVDLWHDASGAIAVEYGLIAALVAVVIIGSLTQLGETLLALPLQSVIDAIMGTLS